MQQFILYNGELIPADKPVFSVKNRSFRYGDGIFESVRVIKNNICFLNNHVERLMRDATFLNIQLPAFFTAEFLSIQIKELLKKNGILADARVRVTLFRKEGGFYAPIDNSMEYLIEANALYTDGFNLNKTGLIIDIYEKFRKPLNLLSNLKTNNALLFVLSSMDKIEKNLDDCLILNELGNIAEATSSNFFLVSSGKIYTPSLEEGCVAGTMRKTIIELALSQGRKVYECAISPDDLLNADELFLTNAINGISWIAGFGKKRYFHPVASKLNQLLINLSS
ncbi:MAG: aminotransferase class IV [Bacteroidetes bacterium]|nr:aminotransferase class IV [Bacteroidota bacterium]HET6243436.1 aminotransferase class IV [Bacteroidia bacterium]